MRNIRPAKPDQDERVEFTATWRCPVKGCGWSHAFVPEGMKTKDLIELKLFGSVEIRTNNFQTSKIDAACVKVREHLESHSDEELSCSKETNP